jgi:hypothetical protein
VPVTRTAASSRSRCNRTPTATAARRCSTGNCSDHTPATPSHSRHRTIAERGRTGGHCRTSGRDTAHRLSLHPTTSKPMRVQPRLLLPVAADRLGGESQAGGVRPHGLLPPDTFRSASSFGVDPPAARRPSAGRRSAARTPLRLAAVHPRPMTTATRVAIMTCSPGSSRQRMRGL